MTVANQVASQLVHPHHYIQQQEMGRNNKVVFVLSKKTISRTNAFEEPFRRADRTLGILLHLTLRDVTLPFSKAAKNFKNQE